MKVLQVHCTYRYQGGEDSVVSNERELLRQSGIEVDELTFSNGGRLFQKLVQVAFNLRAYRKTLKKIRSFRPDIVHIHNLHFAASPSVIFAIRKCGVPFVQTLHNYRMLCPSGVLFHQGKLFLHSINQGFPYSAVMAGVYRNSRVLTGWLAFSTKIHQWMGTWEKADRYIVLTEHAKQIFLSSGIKFRAGQLTIKPNFATPSLSPKAATSEHFVFMGRLSEEKGIALLLKAFAGLPHRIRIAGDGPLRDEVIAYSRQYPNIEYAGVIEKNSVSDFLSAGTALIFPSTWYEGMPMVLLEAFAAGLPIIASRLGAMEEMIKPGHNGEHFTPGDASSLQAAVNQYHVLPHTVKQEYSRKALATYRELYTPEDNAAQLLSIYHDVTRHSPIPSVSRKNLPSRVSKQFNLSSPISQQQSMNRLFVFSIPVTTGTYQGFVQKLTRDASLGKSYYTCIANVHMLIEAYLRPSFAEVVKRAGMISPDGRPLTWAIRMLFGIKQERVAGMDLLPDLLSAAAVKSIPVYFYGGDSLLIEKTSAYLQKNLPNLIVAGMESPPFRPLLPNEEAAAVDRINASGAALVFVSLGCPKQEKWMAAVSPKVNAILIGIGGALPVLIGDHHRAPKWLQNAGLEWLFRLSQEPARLFRRYAVTNSIFLYLFIKAWLQLKISFEPYSGNHLIVEPRDNLTVTLQR